MGQYDGFSLCIGRSEVTEQTTQAVRVFLHCQVVNKRLINSSHNSFLKLTEYTCTYQSVCGYLACFVDGFDF